jgi:uncharacterized protein YxeA
MKKLLILIVAVEILAFALAGCMTVNITADNESKVLVIQNKPVDVSTDGTIPLGAL